MYDKLFSPVRIGRVDIKNRVAMTAMGVNLAARQAVASTTTSLLSMKRAPEGASGSSRVGFAASWTERA